MSQITPNYYHSDILGSVIALTDGSGAVTTRYNYSPFGETVVIGTDPVGLEQPFRFTGREWDAETGMYYYRARYYAPEMGRFISEDPIRFQSGEVNWYAYVGNNPVNAKDPFGLYGTNDCSYYEQRCKESGGEYYCKDAPKYCNKFRKEPDPNPNEDTDYEGWFRCTRQCLQDCDAANAEGLCPSYTDSFLDVVHTGCHVVCYTACFEWGVGEALIK